MSPRGSREMQNIQCILKVFRPLHFFHILIQLFSSLINLIKHTITHNEKKIYSGAKKDLVSHQLCISHLKRRERPVIIIIGTLQLWQTKWEKKSRKTHCRDFLWIYLQIMVENKYLVNNKSLSQYFVIYPLLAMTEVKRFL